jgi:hypothetical protein
LVCFLQNEFVFLVCSLPFLHEAKMAKMCL